MSTTAEVAVHDYAERAEHLQLMAGYCERRGDVDEAQRCRAAALVVFAAGRAEARNPANPPVQCGTCLGAKYCDPAVHMDPRRAAS